MSDAKNPTPVGVDVAWVKDALSEKEKWVSPADKVLAAMNKQDVDTVVNILRSTDATWARILVGGEQLTGGIIDAIKAKAKVYTCVSRGWRRDLTRECVEPNPGPKGMKKFFDEVAHEFDNVTIARDALITLENAIMEQCLPGPLGYTNDHVKTFFETNAATVTRGLITGAADVTGPLDDEIRARLKLSQVSFGAGPQSALSWAVAAPVSDANFHVPLRKLMLTKLEERAKNKGCTLVEGPYRSGKTSHRKALAQLLTSQGFFCIEITLYNIKNGAGKELSFSAGLDLAIYHQLSPYLPSTYDKGLFTVSTALKEVQQHKAGGKPVVVLWDEFQILVGDAASNTRHDVTVACKTLVDEGIIWSTLAFGTFQLQFLSSESNLHSPFHQNNAMHMNQATDDDMRATILEWKNVWGQKDERAYVDDEVVESWIDQCRGGPLGILSYIGYQLNTFEPTGGLSYDKWNEHYHNILRFMSVDVSTFQRMLLSVKNSTCKELIRPAIVSDKSITSNRQDPKYSELLDMASAGVFTREYTSTHDVFKLSCAAVKHLVLPCISPPSPPISPALFNPAKFTELVTRLLNHLVTVESDTLSNQLCWKESNFPSEVTFQSLFYADIKQAFNQEIGMANYKVLMEARHKIKKRGAGEAFPEQSMVSNPLPAMPAKETTQRSDLYVANGVKFLLELKSNVRFTGKKKAKLAKGVESAVNQTSTYAKSLGLTTALLLNIVDSVGSVHFQNSVYKKNDVTVHVFQAQLAADFKSWQFY